MEGLPIKYWGVEDTTIAALDPDKNQGTAYTLDVSPTSAILIRFADLDRVVGRGGKVTAASLVLTSVGGKPGVVKSVARVLKAWRPGPAVTLSSLMKRPVQDPTKPNAKGEVLPRTVTWRDASVGVEGWQLPGASGPSDSQPVANWAYSADANRTTITGLAEAIQAMKDHPFENYGLLIRFESVSEFAASLSKTDRPKLVLDVEDAEAPLGLVVTHIETSPERPKVGESVTFTAHVKNMGTAASGPITGRWIENGKPVQSDVSGAALQPGQEATFSVSRNVRAGAVLGLRLNDSNAIDLSIPEDAAPAHVSLPSGKDALWAQTEARTWNEVIAPQSRFSFAPEGALAKVRIQAFDGPLSDPIKAFGAAWNLADTTAYQIARGQVDLDVAKTRSSSDRYAGLFGSGDTRFDGPIPALLQIPAEPVSNPLLDMNPLEATGLLSATDVGDLNAAVQNQAGSGLPKTSVIHAISYAGAPLANAGLTFYQSEKGRISDKPTFTVKTDNLGRAVLPSNGGKGPFGDLLADGSNGVFLVTATQEGVTEATWLKAWQLKDAARRGSAAAAVVDLRFNLGGTKLDTATNLAQDRIVSDSKGDFPAQLNALIDGNEATAFSLPSTEGSWVEIDLGRDRTIAEVRLLTKEGLWSQFDILAYATGQRPSEAFLWAKEVDWNWTAANRSDSLEISSVAYRNAPQRVRFIRIVSRAAGSATLNEVKISPALVTQGS